MDLQERLNNARETLRLAQGQVRSLEQQIPKPPPVCQVCGRPATWNDCVHGDYKERYCAEHYHEYVKFPDGDLAEWAAAIAGEALVAAEARVAELEKMVWWNAIGMAGAEASNDSIAEWMGAAAFATEHRDLPSYARKALDDIYAELAAEREKESGKQ